MQSGGDPETRFIRMGQQGDHQFLFDGLYMRLNQHAGFTNPAQNRINAPMIDGSSLSFQNGIIGVSLVAMFVPVVVIEAEVMCGLGVFRYRIGVQTRGLAK